MMVIPSPAKLLSKTVIKFEYQEVLHRSIFYTTLESIFYPMTILLKVRETWFPMFSKLLTSSRVGNPDTKLLRSIQDERSLVRVLASPHSLSIFFPSLLTMKTKFRFTIFQIPFVFFHVSSYLPVAKRVWLSSSITGDVCGKRK